MARFEKGASELERAALQLEKMARATDPGWTPSFVNTAGIVLEVVGALQHGALVAREYGKPCVVGITDVVNRLADGILVEIDGSEGVVRLLTP